MKMNIALSGALACLLIAGSAQAQGISEDRAWQFRSPSETVVLQNNSNMIQLQKSGYYELMKNGSLGAAGGGGGGLLGTSASATQNFFQVFQQTTNNCTGGSAVGATLTCGSGSQEVSGTTQTSTGNTTTSTSTVTDNVVTNKDNTTNANTGGGTQNNTPGN